MAVQFRDISTREDIDLYIDWIIRSSTAEENLIDLMVDKLRGSASPHKRELVQYAFERFDALDHQNEHASGTTPPERNAHRAAALLGKLKRQD